METTQVNKRSNTFKVAIIILLVLVIALLTFIGYFTIFRDGDELASIFSSTDEEHTILLEEFLVNLKTEDDGRNYLKTEIAVMFTEKSQEDFISTNILKIRDTIINDLRLLTSDEILKGENTANLKISLTESINTALGEDIIKDIYFSDLIIQ